MSSDPTQQRDERDVAARVIVLLYGTLGTGAPFWLYAAVKPSRYQEFQEAQRAGQVDLTKFKLYGEIVVSGEGRSPPEDVTKKVAALYSTDPAKFFQPLDVEQEVAERVRASDGKETESTFPRSKVTEGTGVEVPLSMLGNLRRQ